MSSKRVNAFNLLTGHLVNSWILTTTSPLSPSGKIQRLGTCVFLYLLLLHKGCGLERHTVLHLTLRHLPENDTTNKCTLAAQKTSTEWNILSRGENQVLSIWAACCSDSPQLQLHSTGGKWVDFWILFHLMREGSWTYMIGGWTKRVTIKLTAAPAWAAMTLH